MSDLTPLFHQCVEIVAKELGTSKSLPRKEPPYFVHDSFAKECLEIYQMLVRLASFLVEIRPLYLQVNDEYLRFDRNSVRELSSEDKMKLDEEFSVKIQQLYEKLKYLQTYERKRNQLLEQKRKSKGFIFNLFSSDGSDPEALYDTTSSSHRTQMLRFLSDTTRNVNTQFERMQRKRHSRERQLNLLHFQNLDDEDDVAVDKWEGDEFNEYEVELEESPDAENIEALSQEQIQELLAENAEILTLKTNQFKQVENLHNSMVDIVKLQTELTMHLETQAEQINTLMDNQDQVEIDLRMGNKNLSKATERNKRGSNLIVTTCIVLGCLILFVDYIS